jgi:hypothetical protein
MAKITIELSDSIISGLNVASKITGKTVDEIVSSIVEKEFAVVNEKLSKPTASSKKSNRRSVSERARDIQAIVDIVKSGKISIPQITKKLNVKRHTLMYDINSAIKMKKISASKSGRIIYLSKTK